MILWFSIFGNRYYFTFKFFGLAFVFIFLFACLGVWQCHRAMQKKQFIQVYHARLAEKPITLAELLDNKRDNRFYPVQLKGRFDNAHHILLDNKTFEGQAGYEIYTPFLIAGTQQAILINRGWVPASSNRTELPAINKVEETLILQGTINNPPLYFSLGAMAEPEANFPLRVQFIDLNEISGKLPYPIIPYIIWLDPNLPHGFLRQWQVTFTEPEKHILYAGQWFAFALSLLVIFVALNFHREKLSKGPQ